MNTKTLDDNFNIKLYESLLKKYGENYRTLNWGSSKSQKKRFKVLAEVGLKSGDSVLDVGCGLSDLYIWLKENIPGIIYEGIDLTPAMIEISQKRFPKIKFTEGTIDNFKDSNKNFDYIISSGIFVYRKNSPIQYMKETIKKMYYLSKKGVAFNSLSTLSSTKVSSEFYADPSEIFKFCKDLTNRVVLRHDYHDSDFTIYMYKDKNT